jgi:uncharacterized RDD family membrane protein YckC
MVWILGVLAGIAQLVIPVASMLWIVFVVLKAAFTGPDVDVVRAASYDGRIWVPRAESEDDASKKGTRRWHLLGIDASGQERVSLPPELKHDSFHGPWLAASPDGLFVLSDTRMWVMRGRRFSALPEGERFDPISRPFVFDGAPTVFVREDRTLQLSRIGHDGRSSPGGAGFELPESEVPRDIVVVRSNDLLNLFWKKDDGEIVHIVSRVGHGGGERDEPARVSETDEGFAAGAHAGKLHVAGVVEREEVRRVEVLRQQSGAWQSTASIDVKGARDLHWIDGEPAATILVETSMGGVQRLSFDGDTLTAGKEVGSGMTAVLLEALAPQGASFVLALLLALLFAGLIHTHRTAKVESEGGTEELASLTRRTCARAVDPGIALLPAAIAIGWAARAGGVDGIADAVSSAAQALYVAWVLLCAGIFTVTEAHFGWTPGKLLLGIRVVGLDGRSCGFGPSVVRNVLLMVDGLLTYLVGTMAIALSEKQQRVGDLAAKMLVVRKRRGL